MEESKAKSEVEAEAGAEAGDAAVEADKEIVKPQALVKVPTLYVRNLNDKIKIEGK